MAIAYEPHDQIISNIKSEKKFTFAETVTITSN